MLQEGALQFLDFLVLRRSWRRGSLRAGIEGPNVSVGARSSSGRQRAEKSAKFCVSNASNGVIKCDPETFWWIFMGRLLQTAVRCVRCGGSCGTRGIRAWRVEWGS